MAAVRKTVGALQPVRHARRQDGTGRGRARRCGRICLSWPGPVRQSIPGGRPTALPAELLILLSLPRRRGAGQERPDVLSAGVGAADSGLPPLSAALTTGLKEA